MAPKRTTTAGATRTAPKRRPDKDRRSTQEYFAAMAAEARYLTLEADRDALKRALRSERKRLAEFATARREMAERVELAIKSIHKVLADQY